MKLAQLIQERGDIQKRIEQLKVRLNNNALKIDSQSTPEDPQILLGELDDLYENLEKLILKINLINNSEGIVELLARRDVLQSKINAYRSFLNAASSGVSSYTKTELPIKPNIDVTSNQKKVDLLSKELRELVATIQEKNWTIEV